MEAAKFLGDARASADCLDVLQYEVREFDALPGKLAGPSVTRPKRGTRALER